MDKQYRGGEQAICGESKRTFASRAKGRDVIEGTEECQVRETPGTYNPFFRPKKKDIGPENAYFWDITAE